MLSSRCWHIAHNNVTPRLPLPIMTPGDGCSGAQSQSQSQHRRDGRIRKHCPKKKPVLLCLKDVTFFSCFRDVWSCASRVTCMHGSHLASNFETYSSLIYFLPELGRRQFSFSTPIFTPPYLHIYLTSVEEKLIRHDWPSHTDSVAVRVPCSQCPAVPRPRISLRVLGTEQQVCRCS